MKTLILRAGLVFMVAMLSLVLVSPVFAGDAQDNDKKDTAKTFSILKNLEKDKAQGLNEKELKKVKGGQHHVSVASVITGSAPDQRGRGFGFALKDLSRPDVP